MTSDSLIILFAKHALATAHELEESKTSYRATLGNYVVVAERVERISISSYVKPYGPHSSPESDLWRFRIVRTTDNTTMLDLSTTIFDIVDVALLETLKYVHLDNMVAGV